jgi:hypothetical protein
MKSIFQPVTEEMLLTYINQLTGQNDSTTGEMRQYSSIAQKLMSKMGHKSGTGLGKTSQGIVEPISASSQQGRRGLGHILKGLEDEIVDWDPSSETVEVKEIIDWLPPNDNPCPTMSGIANINAISNIKY